METVQLFSDISSIKRSISALAPGVIQHKVTTKELSTALESIKKQNLLDSSLTNISSEIVKLEVSKQNLESSLGTFHRTSNLLGIKMALNLINLRKIYDLCKILITCPANTELFNEALAYEPLRSTAKNYLLRARELKSAKEVINQRVRLTSASRYNLSRMAQVLITSNIFSWFSSEYRTIKRHVKELLIYVPNDKTAAAELYGAFNYLKEEDAFNQDSKLDQLFPIGGNHGISSDFDGLEKWVLYFENLITWIQNSGVDPKTLGRILCLKREDLVDLRQYSITTPPLLQISNSPSSNDEREPLDEKLTAINRKHKVLSDISNLLKKLEVDSDLKCSLLETLVPKIISMERKEQLLRTGNASKILKVCPNIEDYHERGAIESLIPLVNLLYQLDLADDSVQILINNKLSDWYYQVQELLTNFETQKSVVMDRIARAELNELRIAENPLAPLTTKIENAIKYKSTAVGLLDFQDTLDALNSDEIHEFINVITDDDAVLGQFDLAFQYIFYNSLMAHFYTIFPSLFKTVGPKFDEFRQRFRILDDKLMVAYQSFLSTKLCSGHVPEGVSSGRKKEFTELSLIKHLTSLERPNVSVRDLLLRSKGAVQALKPVFLMSPLSVAQTLPPNFKFDVLIMDEASQMKPEDALGSIARAGQIIVVGDPKQMPPSDHFSRSVSDEDDGSDGDDYTEVDQESILDLALATFKRPRRLRWHYRSKNEELIAFSNHYFYENDLVIFPSSKSSNYPQGIFLQHVQGVYKTGLNLIEANATLDTAIEIIRRRPSASMMIVAMNQKQSDLINDLISERIKDDPVLEKYVDQWRETLEPLLVRNLENVQGDERDVVIISTVYGPDANGHVFQRFGPIGMSYGHRRLNVLYTRAKELMVVVTSLDDSRIEAGPTSSRGVHAFKNFLRYAKTKQLGAEITTFGVRPPDSEFELHVARTIANQFPGLEVVAQVGVAGFFIDLAIKHPKKEGAFLIGIECDGKTYHSSKSARDRDKIRQKMLEDLGWNLHRIWSTDWFTNPDRELKKLIAKIQMALAS